MSSLSVEPCEGEFLIVTVFEIRKEEVHRLFLRSRFWGFRLQVFDVLLVLGSGVY